MCDKFNCVLLFQEQRNNPFQMKCIKLALDLETLDKQLDPRVPKVILASQPDLSLGFSRQLFIDWCSNPKNTLIITQRSSSSALSSQLLQLVSDKRSDRRIQIEIFEKIPLQGLELEQYKLDKAREKKRLEEERLNQENDSDSDSDDDAIIGESIDEEDESDLTSLTSADPKPGAQGKLARKMKSNKNYLMFPHHETRVKWDDYGEIINPDDFIMFDQSKKALARDDEFNRVAEQVRSDKDAAAMRVAADAEEERVPMKTVSEVRTLDIKCHVAFIDFEGRSDGESLKKMISMMKPRRVIAVHGSVDACNSLAAYCESIKSDAFIDKVFIPRIGQVVDATTESNIYQVINDSSIELF